MKRFLSVLLFLFILMFCFTCFANEERWRWMYSDEHSGHYFDTHTLTYTYNPDNRLILKAWVKVEHSKWYAQEIVRINNYDRQRYRNYSYDMWGCEINVPDRVMRFTILLHYDDKGNILRTDETIHNWLTIVPEGVSEKYYDSIVRYFYGLYQ